MAEQEKIIAHIRIYDPITGVEMSNLQCLSEMNNHSDNKAELIFKDDAGNRIMVIDFTKL